MTLKYVNHEGKTIDFDSKTFFVNLYDLRDYAWNYDSTFEKITNFNKKGIISKKLSISIHTRDKEQAKKYFNSVFEIFEKDILVQKPGKFYIGDYYFKGYVTENSKSEFIPSQNFLSLDLTVVSDVNSWIKESTFNFSKNQLISGHGYNYGYPYRYSSGALKTFFNESLTDTDFKLIIYGAVSNPSIYIGGNLYKINVLIEVNEYLLIDSKEKTAQKFQSNGEYISVFNFRDRNNYIFKKICAGNVAVSWNNSFGFELTVYNERSEPAWNF